MTRMAQLDVSAARRNNKHGTEMEKTIKLSVNIHQP